MHTWASYDRCLSRSLCTSRQLNCILNDWCCYPAIFKHYHWERNFPLRLNAIRYNEWCVFCVYIQFSRQLHAKNTPTRRQISSSIIIIHHMCISFWGDGECVNRERQILSLAQDVDDATSCIDRNELNQIKFYEKGTMMQGQLLLGLFMRLTRELHPWHKVPIFKKAFVPSSPQFNFISKAQPLI